jgi:hypothetical protein
MKTQKPAEGILLVKDYIDAKIYHVECDCSSSDHAVKTWIEVNRDDVATNIEVGFYIDTWTPYWSRGWNRFRAIWQLLTTGIIRQEHHLILNKQSALNFADTIQQEVKELDKLNA